MTLIYPIANDAREALEGARFARTREEARLEAGSDVELVSQWLRPEPAEREACLARAQAELSRGFVQFYEGMTGEAVIALTFWRPKGAEDAALATGGESAPPPIAEDHTDDLYFAKPATKARRRKRPVDLNQMDLFESSMQRSRSSEG
jgi:hypothetical protein